MGACSALFQWPFFGKKCQIDPPQLPAQNQTDTRESLQVATEQAEHQAAKLKKSYKETKHWTRKGGHTWQQIIF